MSQFLGIEIGGTKLQVGVGRGDGTLLRTEREVVDPDGGGAGIRQRLVEMVPRVTGSESLAGIGIGFGGPVDDATRRTVTSHQIEGWDDFPLAEWAEEYFGSPAALGNDADVAGLAEAVHGAGRGLSPVFYMTLGSGIGGALIVDQRIHRGCGRGAAEVGHLRMHDGESFTILEHLASGWGIERQAKGKTAPMLADLARRGDSEALALLRSAWEALAEGICHVIALLCPRRIILGGGVSLMGEDVLFGPLRALVAERVFRPFRDLYEIVPAELGEEVVLHGAITLAQTTK